MSSSCVSLAQSQWLLRSPFLVVLCRPAWNGRQSIGRQTQLSSATLYFIEERSLCEIHAVDMFNG